MCSPYDVWYFLFYRSIYHTIQDLFLADNVEDQNGDQGQQIGRERQVIVGSKLGLEVQLRQRQRILSGSCMMINGVITSFHTARAVIMATVACMGFMMGKMIFQ